MHAILEEKKTNCFLPLETANKNWVCDLSVLVAVNIILTATAMPSLCRLHKSKPVSSPLHARGLRDDSITTGHKPACSDSLRGSVFTAV